MKKTLIALAAVAVSSAAFAQSSVTLYGKANIGLFKTEGASAALNDGPDGSGSRWGLRGVEDLGGGMKANYLLEGQFNLDSGALNNSNNPGEANTTTRQFGRGAWVGLSGDFGEFRLGRQYSLGFDASIGTMPSTAFSSQRAVGLQWAGTVNTRNSDYIKYLSPSFGGLKVSVGTQLKGDTATANTEVGVAYAAGPLKANFVTTKVKGASGSSYGLNAMYDAGFATLGGGYTDNAGSNTGKGAFVHAGTTMGALSPYLQLARNTDAKATSVEVGAYYALSKRTRAYALLNTRTSATDAKNRYALGLDHSF